MSLRRIIAVAALLALSVILYPHVTVAQPVCSTSFPQAPSCQQAATNLQTTDILFGQQATGPSRNNQTVKVSIAQIIGSGSLPGSFSTLNTPAATISTLTASAGALVGTFTGPTMFSNVLPTLSNYTTSTLPASPANGTLAVATDCKNGSQSVGTGCVEVYVNGSWLAMPSPPNQAITIGGQSVYIGGSTINTGTGSSIQTSNAASSFVAGHVPQYDATGALIDSGSGPGGGGGSGSVSSCATGNSPAIYSTSGTTVSCIAGANSSVLVSGVSGTLSLATTLPGGLTIPNPLMTGSGSFVSLTASGALTLAPSASGSAYFTIPQGVAPTSPSNGNIWTTSAGMFGRFNGATVGPLIGVAQLAATAPVVDSGGTFSCPSCATTSSGGALTASSPVAISGAGAISCTTCATTTNGGALTATPPMAISAGGVISLGETTVGIPFIWNATTTVTNDSYLFYWPQATGHIQSVKYYTGGSSTPSFTANVQVNGTNVTGCNAISVTASNTQGSPGSTSCTSTAITSGQPIKLSISSVSGTPFSAMVEIIGTRSAL